MADAPGLQQIFQLVIEAKFIGRALFTLGATGQHRAVGRAVGVNQITVFLLDGGVTGVLAEGEVVGELVFQLVANHRLLAPGLIVIRIADVKVAWDVLPVDAFHRAIRGQEVAVSGIRIFLVAGQQRKAGLIVRIPGDRRGDRHPRLFIIVHLIMLRTGDTVHAIQYAAVVAQPAAEIKRTFGEIVIAGAELHVVNGLRRRALAGHAD